MKAEISKKFRFESAHYLPGFPEGHKCRRMHGHSFEVEIFVEGEIGAQTGVVIDYGDIKRVVKPVVDALDHRVLNELGDEWGAAATQPHFRKPRRLALPPLSGRTARPDLRQGLRNLH